MTDTITIQAWVATDPELGNTNPRKPVTVFRAATVGNSIESATHWFTVVSRHGLATNVAKSIKKGQPVIITGLVLMTPNAAGDTTIEATVVGHDLVRGVSRFERV